jgi:Domain of unknown function (DUF4157)
MVLQRQRASGKQACNGRCEAPPIVHEVLQSPGHPVEAGARAHLEPRLGRDLSGVRVHSDARAAESARATGALAYAVGRDVVFGRDQYRPHTHEGLRLLSHELTHVAQQDSAPRGGPLTIGSENHPAETEAQEISNRISVGAPHKSTFRTDGQPTLRRSVAGDVGGTLAGAAVGAGAGFAIGGPIGALVGGLLGGVGGLILGDTLSADKRGLTPQEKQEAQLVFGNGLNYGGVQIAESPIMGIGANARTPFDTIYFPPGTSKLPFSDFMPWLIHELTHVWQYQHGVSVFTKLFWALHGAKAYNYGGEPALKLAAAQHKSFRSFNTEQQGDILRDYYNKLKAGEDTSAYDPFITEVQGRKLGDFPSPQTAPKYA